MREINYKAMCYGSISLFSTMLHNVFLIYHIEMFLSVYKIDKTSFWIGEVIFLVWNSINDPLFGWIADGSQVTASSPKPGCGDLSCQTQQSKLKGYSLDRSSQSGASTYIIVKRTRVIGWCGPLMALSFMTFWLDWHNPCIQFATCLCLYDSFLTLVDLQQSALLADLSITTEDRADMNSYEAIFSAIGSISVFLSYRLWDKHNLTDFQILCATLAVISAIGFYTMSSMLRSAHVRDSTNIGQGETHINSTTSSTLSPTLPLRVYIRQLTSHKNFLRFIFINLIQVFHCHFNSNFLALFMEALVDDHRHYGSFLIGISFVIPHLNNILFLRLCKQYGVYSIVQMLFAAKIVLSLIMLWSGVSYGWLMCFFIASNRVCTEGTCKLLNLVIADLVDEDYVRNNRSEPISMLLFGTVNFLAKPGQTLAPIVGTSLISALAGVELFSAGGQRSVKQIHQTTTYKESCYLILVYVPLVCGVLQLFAWSFFKLRGAHLHRVKSARSNLQNLLAV